MSDPNPNPDDPLPSKKERISIRWQRVSTYLGSIALIIAMWICALLYVIREHPDRFVAYLLAQCPQPSSADRVFWVNRRTLEIDNIKIGGFFYADSIIVTASPFGLIRRHVAKVVINSGQVFTKPLYEAMDRNNGKDSDGINWTIGALEIKRGTLMLQNFVPDAAVPIRLGVRWPLIIHDLRLGKPDNSPEMNKVIYLDVENVALVSPFDPLSPVLYLPLTEVTFTYAEFWHHHIRAIDLLRPTLFVGQDLFWFTSQFSKAHANRPEEGTMAPWEVSRFEVEYGQMAISAFGQPVVHFPFFFDTKVNDIRLDQLDKISVKSVIAIQQLSQDYPDYKIQIVNLGGRLYFSLPPSDKDANNVVNTLHVDEVSWNDIPITDVNSTATFDQQGIYGKLNGNCEGGQLSGNFEFYYTKGFTWNVDFFADKVNVQPIAEKLGSKYFNMTGELDGDLTVDGQVTDIQKVKGELTLPKPGVVHIKSLKEMLDRLPPDMNDFKKQAIGIAVDTFATYPYTSGVVKCDYENQSGVGSLILNGPNGKRHLDIHLHPFVNDQSSSKVANTADNQ